MNPVRTRAASFDWRCIPLGCSGSGSMIRDRLNQVNGTNESTLIGNSLVSLMHNDASSLVTIPFWLQSLGMIWIRISDPRSLGSNQRNQWIHSGSFGVCNAPWIKWSFCIPLKLSELGSMILDHLDHGEQQNRQFIYCRPSGFFDAPGFKWSWIIYSDSYHPRVTHVLRFNM